MDSASAPKLIDEQPQTPQPRHTSPSKVLFAGIVIALVGVVIVVYLIQSHKHQLEVEQKRVEALQAENARLQETPDYQYRQAVDLQNEGALVEARTAFETILKKFPTSNLVPSAKQRLAEVNSAILELKAKHDAAMQKLKEQEEADEQRAKEEEKLNGTSTSYSSFYAMTRTGIQVNKRYRFRAEVAQYLALGSGSGQIISSVVADFDSTENYKAFLASGGSWQAHTVVASLGNDGNIHIHRID